MASEPIYGSVEAGGTKFICAVGRSVHDVLEEKRIATRQPAETLAEVLQFFHAMQIKYGPYARLRHRVVRADPARSARAGLGADAGDAEAWMG
jgi:hypothetical protein